jgi:hypothetical protein
MKRLTNFFKEIQRKYILQPFADIIILYLKNANSEYEFAVGYNMGLLLDTYATYKGIELS